MTRLGIWFVYGGGCGGGGGDVVVVVVGRGGQEGSIHLVFFLVFIHHTVCDPRGPPPMD
jgi:hypothetical protein